MSLDALAISIGFVMVVFAGGLVFFQRMTFRLLTSGARQPDDVEDDDL